MPITAVLELIKLPLSKDVATLNSAHGINMDTLSAWGADVVACILILENSINTITPATSELKLYSYPLDVTLPDATPEILSDGTSVTKNALVFSVIHITDLVDAVFQIVDFDGKIVTENLDIQVDQNTTTNMSITMPVIYPANLKLVILNNKS